MLFLENKRLLPTSGSCFCLAWLWWQAKFWSSIQSSLLTISIILHFTGQLPNPVAAGLFVSEMRILTRRGWCWCKLLVTRCSAHSNSSSTQRSRPHVCFNQFMLIIIESRGSLQYFQSLQLFTLTLTDSPILMLLPFDNNFKCNDGELLSKPLLAKKDVVPFPRPHLEEQALDSPIGRWLDSTHTHRPVQHS